MRTISQTLELLGRRVLDVVTGLEGVVTSVSFDVYGNIQYLIQPGLRPDGAVGDPIWVDDCRLQPLAGAPVLVAPDYSLWDGGVLK